MDKINIITSILTGLAAAIPLVVALVKYIKAAVQERNWYNLLELLMGYMERAEAMFSTGAERKEWVLAMVRASADTINYNIDITEVGKLIDSLCGLTKAVNAEVANTPVGDAHPGVPQSEAVTCEE